MSADAQAVMSNFPAGLRLLVVDGDFNGLSTLERLLQAFQYEVTTCQRATDALSLLRGGAYDFDIVLTEIYMPEMDGFQLLEIIRKEMDNLPVVMMSSDGRKEAVMKAVNMGACDYLMKPIRKEEMSVLWQHAVRKQKYDLHSLMLLSKLNGSPCHGGGGRGGDDESRNGSRSPVENCGSSTQERREEELHRVHKNDILSLKKPRMIWTPELHRQFVAAVNHIGLANAVPKKILEHMKVAGLTRENVASHLQKYRLYLERNKKKKFNIDAHPPPVTVPHYTSRTQFPSQASNVKGEVLGASTPVYHGYNYNQTFSESSFTFEEIRNQENFQAFQRIEGVQSFNEYTAYYAIPMACTSMIEVAEDHSAKLSGKYECSAQETQQVEGGTNSDYINFCPCTGCELSHSVTTLSQPIKF